MAISRAAYLTILAALSVERIVELRLSDRNSRRALAAGAIEAGRAHYLPMAAFHVAFIICAAAESIIFNRSAPWIIGWLALAFTLIAQVLRYWCVATLGPFWNTRIIVWPETVPVTSGPYRFVRHPNYLAVIIEIACVPLIGGCWLTAVTFSIGNAVLLAVRIRAEEAAMGPGYQSAFGRRPRFVSIGTRV